MSDKFLWEFHCDCRRMGSVNGLFVATEELVRKGLNKHVSFGEILGKHSDVYGTLEENDLTKIDLDSETVEKVTALLGETWSGYNPLNNICCSRCGEHAQYCGMNGLESFNEDGECYDCAQEGDEE